MKIRMKYGLGALAALSTALVLGGAPLAAAAAPGHWVTTWGCGPQLTEPANLPPATLAKSNQSYTQALLPWQGSTVGFLDADHLFSSLNLSLT